MTTRTRAIIRGSLKTSFIERNSAISRRSSRSPSLGQRRRSRSVPSRHRKLCLAGNLLKERRRKLPPTEFETFGNRCRNSEAILLRWNPAELKKLIFRGLI